MSKPKKKGRRLTKFEREEHLAQVMRLYLRKMTKADIARKLGVDRSQITYDVRAVEKKLQAQQLDDLAAAKQMQLMELQFAKLELYEAWEKSKKTYTKRGVKMKGIEGRDLPAIDEDDTKKPPIQVERQVQRETRYGDVRVMHEIVGIINLEAELMGTKAPKKLEHGGDRDNPVVFETRDAWFSAINPLLESAGEHIASGDGAPADE